MEVGCFGASGIYRGKEGQMLVLVERRRHYLAGGVVLWIVLFGAALTA